MKVLLKIVEKGQHMNKKMKLRLVAILVLVSLLVPTGTVESLAANPTNATALNYEIIRTATTGYFTMCESTVQEKLTSSCYVTDQYKGTCTATVDAKSYDVVKTIPELQALSNARATGILNYIKSVDLRVMSWNTYIGEPTNVVFSDNGEVNCEVYIWTEFEWCNSDFPKPMQSGYGTLHTLTLTSDLQVISDQFDEQDISGINTRTDTTVKENGNIAPRSIIPSESITPYVLPASGPNQLINRSSVVTYANQYVGNYSGSAPATQDYTHYNRKYINFNYDGGDCVNYVSQCLNNAGLPQTSNWYYRENGTSCTNSSHEANNNTSLTSHSCTANDSCSASWSDTDSFITVMCSAYPSDYDTSPTAGEFCVGDVGFLCNGSNGAGPRHAFICVGTGSSTFLINAHNNDRKNVAYNNGMISDLNIIRVHIHSPSSAWLKYDSYYHYAPCNAGCGYNYYGIHYAQVPSQNGTCLGCGYVGNIPSGMS